MLINWIIYRQKYAAGAPPGKGSIFLSYQFVLSKITQESRDEIMEYNVKWFHFDLGGFKFIGKLVRTIV